MADAPPRSDVIRVMREAGIAVEPTDRPDTYRLTRGDRTIVKRLLGVVSGTTISGLVTLFEIPKSRFYPPVRSASVVVPIDRGKVSGDETS